MKREKKFYSKGDRAITLIALIVTIVVLLILAGVSINMLTGENGLITRAKDAKDELIVGEEREQVELAYTSAKVKKIYGYINKDDLQEELDNSIGNEKTTVTGGNTLKVKFEETGNEYKVTQNGNVENYEVPKATDIYAKLYEDGTLILSSIDYNDESKSLTYDFGKINNKSESTYWSNSNYNKKIQKIIIYDEIVPTNTHAWFANLTNLTDIENIEKLDTSLATDMSEMFMNCKLLKDLDVSNFNTTNVTKMSYMFNRCCELNEIDISNFDTSNVKDMSYMFAGRNCYNRGTGATSYDGYMQLNKIVGLNNIDTSSVTNMRGMFSGLIKIKEINLSNFNTSNVQNMNCMFFGDKLIESLDLSSFDTTNVTDMAGMFANCQNLESLNLSNFITTTNLTRLGGHYYNNSYEMYGMFYNCRKLSSIDLSNFDTSNVTEISNVFMYCDSLKYIDISSWDLSSVTTYVYFIAKTTPTDCKIIVNPDTAEWIREKFPTYSNLEVISE